MDLSVLYQFFFYIIFYIIFFLYNIYKIYIYYSYNFISENCVFFTKCAIILTHHFFFNNTSCVAKSLIYLSIDLLNRCR